MNSARNSSKDDIIVFENLTKSFNGVENPILAKANGSIARGDYLAIVGRSGSGKSTLLNLLGLLDTPSSGSISILGTDVANMSESERSRFRGEYLGFVFQDFHLMSKRSALDNVSLGLLYRGINKEHRTRRARQCLDMVMLEDRHNALPSTLSGGERQRVAIARAIIGDPVVLLCDEPTGNLDPESARAVIDLFDNLRSSGIAIVVVTHDDSVAIRADKVLRLSDGHLDVDSVVSSTRARNQ